MEIEEPTQPLTSQCHESEESFGWIENKANLKSLEQVDTLDESNTKSEDKSSDESLYRSNEKESEDAGEREDSVLIQEGCYCGEVGENEKYFPGSIELTDDENDATKYVKIEETGLKTERRQVVEERSDRTKEPFVNNESETPSVSIADDKNVYSDCSSMEFSSLDPSPSHSQPSFRKESMGQICSREKRCLCPFPIQLHDFRCEKELKNDGSTDVTSWNTTMSKSHSADQVQTLKLTKIFEEIREEHYVIKNTLRDKEFQLNEYRKTIQKISSDRDFLQAKVKDLERILVCSYGTSPSTWNGYGSLKISKQHKEPNNHSLDTKGVEVECKMAQRISLSQGKKDYPTKTVTLDGKKEYKPKIDKNNISFEQEPKIQRHSGSVSWDCSKILAEQLTHSIEEESRLCELRAEIEAGINNSSHLVDPNYYFLEMESMKRKVARIKSEKYLLMLHFEEAKAQTQHFALILPQYESNQTALNIALSLSDEAIEAYDVLVALLESELGQLLVSCRAAGIGTSSFDEEKDILRKKSFKKQEHEDILRLIEKSNENRKTAENAAKILLLAKNKLGYIKYSGDNMNKKLVGQKSSRSIEKSALPMSAQSIDTNSPPWEECSSGSNYTAESKDSINIEKHEDEEGCIIMPNVEARIRDHIIQLKLEHERIRRSIKEVPVSSWRDELEMNGLKVKKHCESISPCGIEPCEARRLDLEGAVLMQELMSMREEQVHLRAQIFSLRKEKSNLERQVEHHVDLQKAYKVHVTALKRLAYENCGNKFNESLLLDEEKESETKCLPYQVGKRRGSSLDWDTGSESPLDDKDGIKRTEKDTIMKKNSGKLEKQRCNQIQTENMSQEADCSVLLQQVEELQGCLDTMMGQNEIRGKEYALALTELKNENEYLTDSLCTLKKKYEQRLHKIEQHIMAAANRNLFNNNNSSNNCNANSSIKRSSRPSYSLLRESISNKTMSLRATSCKLLADPSSNNNNNNNQEATHHDSSKRVTSLDSS